MVNKDDARDRGPGMRGRVGEFYYRSGLLRPLQRARALLRQDLRILAYHRVLTLPDPDAFDFDLELISASAEQFREQMQLVKRNFHPMRLGDVVAALDAEERLPADTVVVTFDDGYDDNYHVAYPILRELGVPATFFVSTGLVDSGQPFAFDWLVYMILRTPVASISLPELALELPTPAGRTARRALAAEVLYRLKELDDATQLALIERLEHEWQMPRDVASRECHPMNWQQLREMQAAGFEIGSHGVLHRMLSKLSKPELEIELRDSKTTLELELGNRATLLAYPVGGDRAFDARVMAATQAAGYELACSYICGTNPQPIINRYALYRLPVERVMGLGWFAAMLTLPGLMSYPTVSHAARAVQGLECFS